ncbi:autotransporter outer membrane beta-barrel domain-containing protein [Microvirga sp. W0021]|uniref:Autotransporter outer membrane beta-barrel domain-containing protein n=1 Tax=Hohaiivirga grylli TaxID=3133970 RepID=A0ABV0BN28_9HYPH
MKIFNHRGWYTGIAIAAILAGSSSLQAQVYINTDETVPGTQTSPLHIGNWLYIGHTANGSLTISNAAIVTDTWGSIGHNTGTSGTVTITGAGSQWINSDGVYVGFNGDGNLTVSNGAKVSNTGGYIGYNAGSSGTATVTGTGSQWVNDGILYVGLYGDGYLTVSNGGSVTNHNGTIGADSGSTGKAIVTGVGSQWVSSGNLSAGLYGEGHLTVSAGGLVSSDVGYVGRDGGSSGIVEVTGSGSTWNNIYGLYTGLTGTGSLTISDGGLVTNAHGYIGHDAGSSGSVSVTGPGSQWLNNNSLTVGRSGSGSLVISAGGQVSNTYGIIGHDAGSSGSVSVIGPGSQWSISLYSFIGSSGTGSLSISDGGLVTSNTTFTYIGAQAGSIGTVEIKGNGSTWTSSGTIDVGQYGTGSMTISDGGLLSSNVYSNIGTYSGAHGTVRVTGNGSQWLNNGGLFVGYFGTGNMIVSDGGLVSNTFVRMGANPSSASTVLVTGMNSRWINSGNLSVGFSGSASLTVSNSGAVSATTVYVAEDSGSSGIINIGAAAGIPAVAPGALDTPSLVFGNGDGTLVFNHTDTSGSYHFSPVISGAGQVNHYNGTTVMDGASTYAGPTIVYGGTIVANNTNVFSLNSDYDIRDGAILNLAGYDQTILSMANAGIIQIKGIPGTTLTVTNTYTSNGGSILMNTVLGADNSVTDRLVAGSVVMGSGATSLLITNLGGLGALTTGNGIKVVEVLDASNSPSGAFQLGSRAATGAYEYTLHQNGKGADSSDGNWYLRSTVTIPGDNGGTVEVPNYRPEVPLAASVPPVAIEYGYAMLGTMHERIGDGLTVRPEPVFEERIVRGKNGKRQVIRTEARQSANNQKWFGGAWGRLIGDRGFRDAGSFERHGPSYNYTFSGLQAGLDIYGRETEAGTDKVGIYFGYGNIDAHVKGAYGGKAGNVDMDAYTIGAYWTHKATQGWYTDAVIQGTWYSADATSVYGQKLKPDGFGFIASLEGGYSFNLGNGLTIEPQAQLAYQTMSFDNISDAYGRFYLDNSDSLRGRLGVRIAKNWDTSGTASLQSLTTWVRANVWHEFMGNSKTTTTDAYGLNGVTIPSNLGGTWAEIGAGITAQFTDNVSLFATGAYSHSLDNKGREAWNGRLGINVKW